MSNKTQLQTNNTSFRNDLLSAIKNLPVQESGSSGGAKGVEYGLITVSKAANFTVNHTLGATPDRVWVLPIDVKTPASDLDAVTHSVFKSANKYFTSAGSYPRDYVGRMWGYDVNYSYDITYKEGVDPATFDATSITFNAAGSYYPFDGTYMWFAMVDQ